VGALEDEEESGNEGEDGAAEGESAIGMTGGTVGLGEKDVEPEGSVFNVCLLRWKWEELTRFNVAPRRL